MNENAALPIVVVVLGGALILFVYSSAGRYRDGVCDERWRHQATPAETLSTIHSGCALPGALAVQP